MKIAPLCLAVILSGIIPAPSHAAPPLDQGVVAQMTAQDFYRQGQKKLQKKHYQAAIADYTQAIQLEPGNALAFYQRGYAYHVLHNYPAAIADYTQALQLNPKLIQAYLSRGIARREAGDNQGAIADLNQSMLRVANTFTASTLYHRGLARFNLADYAGAIQDLTPFLQVITDDKIAPRFAEGFYRRGIAYARLGNLQQARTDLQKAAKLFSARKDDIGYQKAQTGLQELRSKP